jgi:DNA-binding MarR family transcriptional regulator
MYAERKWELEMVRTQMKEKERLFAVIEHEIALFVRRAEAVRLAHLHHPEIDRSTYLLLRHLEEHGPLGIKSMADAFQLDVSTASRQTAALEAKGFVERMADPKDARISLLRVTAVVPEILAEARLARERFYAELLQEWPEEECRMLGSLLAKFNRTAERRQKNRR